MAIVADSPLMRERQVSVSDFDPIRRPHLIRAIPQAAEVWEAIRSMLAANNVSETEFFHTFDDRIT